MNDLISLCKTKTAIISLLLAIIGGGSCWATTELSVSTPHGELHFHGTDAEHEGDKE